MKQVVDALIPKSNGENTSEIIIWHDFVSNRCDVMWTEVLFINLHPSGPHLHCFSQAVPEPILPYLTRPYPHRSVHDRQEKRLLTS